MTNTAGITLLLLLICNVNLRTVESFRPFLSHATPSTFRNSAWLVRGGATVHEEEDSTESVEREDNDEDIDEEKEEEEVNAKPTVSHKPVPVTIQTSTGHKILDHSLELTVNRSRDIASLKDSIRRQLPGRPPVATMQLVWRGKRLPDDTIVDELVEDDEEDDDDDDEEDEQNAFGLVLQLDMVPPIDPKFLPQLQQEIPHWTTAELLEAYAANEAALYQNAATLFPSHNKKVSTNDKEDDEDEEQHSQAEETPLITELIRQQAERIHTQWKNDLLTSTKSQQILADPIAPSEQSLLQATQVRGQRVRQLAVTGVKTSLKLRLQRQFNIDWAASIRSFCLFLFFGWFGGRTPTSRAILLFGAPAVFVLQARPVQLFIKQILYFLLLNPPGMILSLLPAPQQMILAIKTEDAMERIYGPDELGASVRSSRSSKATRAPINIPLEKLSPSLSDDELDNYVESILSEVDEENDELNDEESSDEDNEEEDEDEDEEDLD